MEEILLEYIQGQSFGKRLIFEGKFGLTNEDILSNSLAEILSRPNLSGDQVYLDCESESLKLKIIQETLKRNQEVEFVLDELKAGEDWGINLVVKSCDENHLESITRNRNKLNRKISKLKKVLPAKV